MARSRNFNCFMSFCLLVTYTNKAVFGKKFIDYQKIFVPLYRPLGRTCKRLALSFVGNLDNLRQFIKITRGRLAPVLCIFLYAIYLAWAVVVTYELAVQSHRQSKAIVPTPCHVKQIVPFWESGAKTFCVWLLSNAPNVKMP